MGSSLGDYLRSRRGDLQPEDVGLRTMPGRRVSGLRRDEVAQLAGISPEYYLRLEQGRGHLPSDQVLRALAKALDLDASAVQYMTRLVAIQSGANGPADTVHLPDEVRARLERMAAGWESTPAYLTDRNQTLLIVNDPARSLLPGRWEPGANLVSLVFDSEWRAADQEWERTARRAVSALRFHGHPGDPRFRELVGSMAIRDEDFRTMWAEHRAAPMESARIALHVADLGALTFRQRAVRPSGLDDHVLVILNCAPASEEEVGAGRSSEVWSFDRCAHPQVESRV